VVDVEPDAGELLLPVAVTDLSNGDVTAIPEYSWATTAVARVDETDTVTVWLAPPVIFEAYHKSDVTDELTTDQTFVYVFPATSVTLVTAFAVPLVEIETTIRFPVVVALGKAPVVVEVALAAPLAI